MNAKPEDMDKVPPMELYAEHRAQDGQHDPELTGDPQPDWKTERHALLMEFGNAQERYELRIKRQGEAITRLTADRSELLALCHQLLTDDHVLVNRAAYTEQFEAIRERIRKNG